MRQDSEVGHTERAAPDGRAGSDGPRPSQLDGRVALVTGASRGIGFEVARGLGRAGATVAMVSRDANRLQEAAEELMESDIDAVPAPCDVSEPEDVAALLSSLGPLAAVDVLVSCAGVMATTRTTRTSPQDWQRVVATNLGGAFHLAASLVPGMLERRWGRVVMVSADVGRFSDEGPAGGMSAYRASKAGVNMLTRTLAAEVGGGRRGVLVDAVAPGHCRTDMGGPEAPRSAAEGADTMVWLATRQGEELPTGLLWRDRQPLAW